ncbi:MAG: helix-turn-helix transcriptional regulator [Coriobacteriales bacterium]|jgi:transcriptional regulator with XRE-family HTH domain|nr:helix-turn-helix transcriptional regulator [Coriobacteriales bacterium]
MKTTYDNESYKDLVNYETDITRSFEYATDLSVAIFNAMEAQGLNQRQLADKMGISKARVSQLLNLQPNMTLKTIAKFELALGVALIEVQHKVALIEVQHKAVGDSVRINIPVNRGTALVNTIPTRINPKPLSHSQEELTRGLAHAA